MDCALCTRCAIRLESVSLNRSFSREPICFLWAAFSLFRILNATCLEDPSTENTANWEKMIMKSSKWALVGEMMVWQGSTGQWSNNHNNGRMCVPPPHISRTGSQLALTRTYTARKRSLNLIVEEHFPYSYFQLHGERSNLTNHCSWSESRDSSRDVTEEMSKWIKASHVTGNLWERLL